MIEQTVTDRLIDGGKVVVIYGPRQFGKTTLVTQILSKLPYRIRKVNADELLMRSVLSSQNLRQLRDLVAGYDVLFIDEAQHIGMM